MAHNILTADKAGRSTNRTGGFAKTIERAKLRDDSGGLQSVRLSQEHTLGGGYVYGGDEDLDYIWKR